MSRPQSVTAPIARKASRCGIQAPAPDHVAAGRRHHRAAEAREQRAGEQERRPDRLGELRLDLDVVDAGGAQRRPRSARASSRSRRSPPRISIIASTSRMRGTLRTRTSSSVRTLAARIGSAPFLFPAGTIVPDSGTPPSMTNFSMSFGRRPPVNEDPPAPPVERLASVTAISALEFAPPGPAPACAGTGFPQPAAEPSPVQLPLQPARPPLRSVEPFLARAAGAYTRS